MKYLHPIRWKRELVECLKSVYLYYLLPDSVYLKMRYKEVFGESLNLNNPQKFSEKIQWLKLHDRKTFYKDLVDKYKVKPIISSIIGEEYIIPTLGMWSKFEDIDFSALPNQFVLKCNHDSASITICRNKDTFIPSEHAWKYTDVFLKRDYYHYQNKQWAYKGIKPCIIAEEFKDDGKYESLTDYKLYCFNGIAKCVRVLVNRSVDLRANMYDMDWNRMPFDHIHPSTTDIIDKPKNLSLMKELAEKIARFVDNPYVRVDFYEVKGKVYFGEVTFYPEGGMGYFDPKEWDYTFGSWIDLNRGAK